ncbi:hypothetical protein GGQ68_004063 [Sagittula marina]|uniref:Mitochondrial inner membrane protein n=1 Tax=Sagittula marina TaxID=943940 RepID=A0A7W6GU17_9RHOB|nr:hypothetical protein [Sagittula marina]
MAGTRKNRSAKGKTQAASGTDAKASVSEDSVAPVGDDTLAQEQSGASVVEGEPDANATTDATDVPKATQDVEPNPEAEGESVAEAKPEANDSTEAEPAAFERAPEPEKTPASDTTSNVDTTPETDGTLGAVTPSAEPEHEQKPVDDEATVVEDRSRTSTATAAVPAVREEKKSSGFVPMVLGGVIAAGLGYGAAYLGFVGGGENPFETETRSTLAAQRSELDGLNALPQAVTDLQAQVDGIDLSALDTGLAGVQDAMSEMNTRLTAIDDQIASMDSRMTALEKQPLAESVSPEAIAAYERELEQLRGAVSDQQTALEAEKAALNEQLEQRTAEMQSIVDEARALETSAEDQARLAAARAAVSDVIARIQEGQAFAEPLAALSDNDVTVPDALQATAEDGVPTMASLSGSFPDAARQALAASRSSAAPEGEADAATSGGLGAFFQSQLGARSVVPKEGNSTDAILSRAEDAVRNSNLDKALTELEALPTEAKDALSDWLSQAELRRDALAQASDLAQQLNQQ